MIQCLKHKAKERPEKRRGNKVNELLPPHLEQPGQRSMAHRMCHICCNIQTFILHKEHCPIFAAWIKRANLKAFAQINSLSCKQTRQ